MGFRAAKTDMVSDREQRNNEIVRRLAPEGVVLLKNNGVLPLSKPEKVALYGAGVRYTIKGGTGSGEVNSRTVVNIEQGFENAGVQVVTKNWLDAYDAQNEKAIADFIAHKKRLLAEGGGFLEVFMGEGFKSPLHEAITEEQARLYEAECAIYVLSRNSGEGTDRRNEENDYKISKSELSSIEALAKVYQQMVVVLNVGGALEMKELSEIEGVDAILHVSQPGNFAGNIVADVVLGKSYPSGKLTTTWGYDYSSYAFGEEYSHLNGDVDDSYYREGIYVGYKYFDTFGIKPAYCFGYGLSYTVFTTEVINVSVDGTKVTVEAKVENMGVTHPGKEVVQVYVSKPQGKLDQPAKHLAGFAKTQELQPGEAGCVTIAFDMTSLASYDEENAQWILEQGDYKILVGTDAENVDLIAAVTLTDTVVTEQVVNVFPGVADFEELHNERTFTFVGEAQWKFTLGAEVFTTKYISYDKYKFTMSGEATDMGYTLTDVLEHRITLEQLVMDLTPEEMAYLCVGSGWENQMGGGDSIVGNAAITVPGAAGETTSHLENRKVPHLVLADGPAGLRLVSKFGVDEDGRVVEAGAPMQFFDEILSDFPHPAHKEVVEYYYQYCTAMPIATMLAQSFNMEVMEELGDMIGSEMEEFGVHLWLAPGMNIHRNVLCGRNYEYYSEDPLVAGACAAAVTKGVQKHRGTGTTIKHFALNNQEENRLLNNSHAGERAIREIYLKGFEICVKEAAPKSVMTSYNLINSEHAATNVDLLKKVLRNEWGFEGLVMSDWGTTGFEFPGETPKKQKYANSSPAGCMVAGNALIMPGFQKDMDRILEALEQGDAAYGMTIQDLRLCAKDILQMIIELRFA